MASGATMPPSSAGEDAALRLFDLSYRYSDDIFGYLSRTGHVAPLNPARRLRGFFITVSFVLFWMRHTAEQRLSGTRRSGWDGVYSEVRRRWGAFFADYPGGPSLDGMTAEAVGGRLARDYGAWVRRYRAELESRGAVRALNGCCHRFFDDVYKTTSMPEAGGPDRNGDDETGLPTEIGEVIVYQLCRIVERLTRELEAVLLKTPL